MAIKVIVELQAKPGRRDELKHVLESLIATQGPGQDGFLGSTRYGVLGATPTSSSRSPIGNPLRRGTPT
jgi:hypothetical protein